MSFAEIYRVFRFLVAVCDARRTESYANYGGYTNHHAGRQEKRGQHTDTEGRQRHVSPFAYLTAFHWSDVSFPLQVRYQYMRDGAKSEHRPEEHFGAYGEAPVGI